MPGQATIMDHKPLHHAVRTLRNLTFPTGLGDAELLERFVSQRDAAAFELLVRRHGPMVLGVCRRLLGHAHDAEDAFQATFLALARKAGAIQRGGSVGSWLYHVAYRVALRARAERARRGEHEQPVLAEPVSVAEEPGTGELRQVLDEEVNRLPARQRSAFILCCLEGKTGEEAARELRCPPGTISSRLTRARERLRVGLTRRGLAPAVLAGAMASESPVPAALVESALSAALLFTAGAAAEGVPSALAVHLAEGVLRAMTLTKLRIAALLLAVCLLSAGGVFTLQALQATLPEQEPPGPVQKTEAVHETEAVKKKDPRPIEVWVEKPRQGKAVRVYVECRIDSTEREDLFARVPGVLKNVGVELGSRVKTGQLLAEIDAPELLFESKQANASVQQARGQVREAEARITAAKAEVEVAKSVILQREADINSAQEAVTLVEREMRRVLQLAKEGAVSHATLGEKESKLATAKSQVPAAKAAFATARADVEVKVGNVAQVEAALETVRASLQSAEISLEKAAHARQLTRIEAPFDGVVTALHRQNGAYLRAGDAASRVLTVQRTDRLKAVILISEKEVANVEVGDQVELRLKSLTKEFTGYTISRAAFAVDPTNGAMQAEIDIPNPPPSMRPGMAGMVKVLKREPALFISSKCLPVGHGLPGFVYVVRGGKAYLTKVEGTGLGDDIEITSGLRRDDVVVLNPGVFAFQNGLPVVIKEGPPPR